MEAAASAERTSPIRRSFVSEDPVTPTRSYSGFVRHPRAVLVSAAALSATAFVSYSAVGDRLIASLIAVVLVVVTATDLERRIIPNRVVLPATVIVLIAHIAATPARGAVCVVAAAGAGLAFLIPNLIGRSLMGMGDVKLAIFLGAGLGPSVVGAVTVAFLCVFPFALGTVIRGGLAARKSTLPFGPFLAFGALVILIVPRLVGVA